MRRFFEMELSLSSLALLRVSLGLVVLWDLLLRLGDLVPFYCDQGFFPRLVFLQSPHATYLNFYLMAGTPTGVGLLFLLTALAALALTLGWRTRTATLATWVLVGALKSRNPLILDGGDLELTLVLFFGFFLPWNARFSLDALANPQWLELEEQFHSPATFGYAFQIAIMYLMSGVCKTDPVWRETGLALYYVFNIDQFATDLAKLALNYPNLLRYLTFTALGLEFFLPLLIFWPLGRRFKLTLAWILICLFHLGILFTIHLGLMPVINILAAMAFWPATWSSWVLQHAERAFQTAARLLPKPSPCRSQPSNYQLGPVTRAFVTTCILYVAYINWAGSISKTHITPMPIKVFGYVVQLYQDWFLFAPAPMSEDGWYVLEGQLTNGERVDLLRGGQTLSLVKPVSVALEFPNHRWRRWMQNMESRKDARVFEAFCRAMAAQWNHPQQRKPVVSLDLIFVSEPTGLPDQKPSSTPVSLFRYQVPQELLNDPRHVRID